MYWVFMAQLIEVKIYNHEYLGSIPPCVFFLFVVILYSKMNSFTWVSSTLVVTEGNNLKLDSVRKELSLHEILCKCECCEWGCAEICMRNMCMLDAGNCPNTRVCWGGKSLVCLFSLFWLLCFLGEVFFILDYISSTETNKWLSTDRGGWAVKVSTSQSGVVKFDPRPSHT